jgi:SAM-dependent methyltransferase
MAGITSIILDKIQQLAGLVGRNVALKSSPGQDSPSTFIQVLTSLSRQVNCYLVDTIKGPASLNSSLISDLFAFLSDLPDFVPPEINFLKEFPPEPLRGWLEPRSDFFWILAALIQDVWEHTFGSEAECDPRILKTLLELNSRRVLDFGSGVGYFAFHLARAGAQITCLEPNPLKRRFIAFRKARCAEGDRIRLSESDQQYDLVLAINVLDHLRSPVGAVRKLASRTIPGGTLACVAAFPEDGWHTGSVPIRASVYREFMRYFRYPDSTKQPDLNLILLNRQRSGKKTRKKKLLQLHPAAVLARDPSTTGLFTLFAPRFYVQPLVLTSDGVVLANLCRARRTLDEIICEAQTLGLDAAEVQSAIKKMQDANLIVTA